MRAAADRTSPPILEALIDRAPGDIVAARFAELSGKIVQVEMLLGDDLFTVVVDDADAVGAAVVEASAETVIPIKDRYYRPTRRTTSRPHRAPLDHQRAPRRAHRH